MKPFPVFTRRSNTTGFDLLTYFSLIGADQAQQPYSAESYEATRSEGRSRPIVSFVHIYETSFRSYDDTSSVYLVKLAHLVHENTEQL